MSLFGSLFSGVSGLSAQSQSMGMISDNVSNVNTTAYKGAVAQFSNLVTRSAGTSTFTPGGVRAGTLYRIANQGLIQNSESPTDAALDGRGFFVVNPLPDGRGEQLYTRAGSFRPDFLGNMRNASGFYLQGWALDANGEVANINRLETVNIRLNGSAAATSRIEIGANLDANQAPFAGPYVAGDMAAFHNGAGGVQPHFSRAIQVFDSLGSAHNLTLAFLKDPDLNAWRVEVLGEAGELDAAHPNGLLAAGRVEFNGNGTLAAVELVPVLPGGALAGDPITADWANGAFDSELTVDLGVVGEAIGLTQFDSNYSVAYTTQNGAEVGELNGVSIDENGFVIASFTNGQEQRIYKLPVATFANPVALDPRSGNVFAQTDNSGAFNLHEAGRGGAGKISPSSLEAANVDLADEFTKLIVTQRAYSANARIISTTDEMLDELIRLKR
jgi:flagellar hook protein FlgE